MKRTQRALDKAQRFIKRLSELERQLASSTDEAMREHALAEIEALVLVRRGSSEIDHRKQLTLSGLQSAFELYLASSAPRADEYAASADQDALLSQEALRELCEEYADEAESFDVADVAAAVRDWARRCAKVP